MEEPTLVAQPSAARAQLGEEGAAEEAAPEREEPPGRSREAEASAAAAEEKPKAAEDGPLRRLQLEHERLKADMAALRRCLRKRGLLSDVDWHRERFEEDRRRTGWSPSGESLQTALAQQPAAVSLTVQAAGSPFASFLRCASPSLRSRLDAVQEERLFVAGGQACAYIEAPEDLLKSGECFADRAGAWRPLPAMGWARSLHAAAALGGSLYVCGGTGDGIGRSVMRLDPRDEGRRWRHVCPMGTPRSRAAAAAVGPWLYVCGGRDGALLLDSAERLRPGTGQGEKGEWEALPAMATKREGPAAAAFEGHLFVCGGWDGASPAAQCSAETFTPSTGSWQGLPSMLHARYGHTAVALRGKVYVVGGEGAEYGRPLASVELYDPAAGAWSSSAELPRPRSCHAAAVLAGRLYVCGGHTGPTPPGAEEPALSSVERFDPETGAWEAAPPMSQARLCCCAAVVVVGRFLAP